MVVFVLNDPRLQSVELLVVLDEMTYAFKYGWLSIDEVLPEFALRPPLQPPRAEGTRT